MITLILAAPRTGKSQLTVSKLWKHKQEGKRVFVTNFKQTPEQRQATGFELFGDDGEHRDVWEGDVSRWFEDLPHGSVWCIDEAQEVFPQRGKHKELPEWIKLLSKHGHHDLTIYVITQDAMQLDVHVRRNCNLTLHMTRPLNMRKALIYTFRGYQELPNDAWRRSQVWKTAESKATFKYSKKWQQMYVSASAHDHIKIRLPWKLLFLPVAVAIVAGLIWWAVARLKGQADDPATAAQGAVAAALTGAQAPSAAASSRGEDKEITPEEYGKRFVPRVPGLAWSAPAYDGFDVQDYPRPYCYISGRHNDCRCVSQQGSRMYMDQAQCRMIVKDGYFDPFRDPNEASGAAPAGQGGGFAPTVNALPGVVLSGDQVSGYGQLGIGE